MCTYLVYCALRLGLSAVGCDRMEYGCGTGTASGIGTGWQTGVWCRQQRSHREHRSQSPSQMSRAQGWPGACTPAEPAASDWSPWACLMLKGPRLPCRSSHCSSCVAVSEKVSTKKNSYSRKACIKHMHLKIGQVRHIWNSDIRCNQLGMISPQHTLFQLVHARCCIHIHVHI